MVLFRPFGPKRLDALEASDLGHLVSEGIEESLFVEYKRDWSAEKVARAVASFANNQGGGTLVVGVEAQGRVPIAIPGVPDDGGLIERLMSVVRSTIAPTPSLTPVAVPIAEERSCLIVEVPEGMQPPYLWITKGQVLIRTPASTEPVTVRDRETLDRLFSAGRRGLDWARQQAEGFLRDPITWENTACIWTIPAVHDGLLSAATTIFRRSTIERLRDAAKGWWAPVHGDERQSMSADVAQYTVSDPGEPAGHTTVSVTRSGIVTTRWSLDQVGAGIETLKTMVTEMLPRHRWILEGILGHRGEVAFAALNTWKTPNELPRHYRILRLPMPWEQLLSSNFAQSVIREARRAQGHLVYEPEPDPPKASAPDPEHWLNA